MIRAGGCSALTAPHCPPARAYTWYSVTLGGGGRDDLRTPAASARTSRALRPGPRRTARRPPGKHTTTSSGSATCRTSMTARRAACPGSARSGYAATGPGAASYKSCPTTAGWTTSRILAQAPLQFRYSLAQLSEPRSRRLQGSPGRRELRVPGLDNFAQPGIGGAQRGHQRGEILPQPRQADRAQDTIIRTSVR